MDHGTEKIPRRRDGENNLVYLQGEEMGNPQEVEGEAPQMMEVGKMMKLRKKEEMKQIKTLSP